MNIEELIDKLDEISKVKYSEWNMFPQGNPDDNHLKADELLLEFINDERVTKSFESIERWYN